MGEATIGRRSPCFARAISIFTYSVHITKIYHLLNDQQQGYMDSLLVMSRGRRCYDDRSMWEPEWSELPKGRFANSHTTSVRRSGTVVNEGRLLVATENPGGS